jgi:hypothetical protein
MSHAAIAETRPAFRRSCVPRESGTWNSTTITVLRMSTAATSTSGAAVSFAIQSGTPISPTPNCIPKTALRAVSAR